MRNKLDPELDPTLPYCADPDEDTSETRVFTHEEFMSSLRLSILEQFDSIEAATVAGDTASVESSQRWVLNLLRKYTEICAAAAHMYE